MPTGLAYPGHNAELAKAVINLAVLTGKIGKDGCGVLILGEKNNSQGAADLAIYPQGAGKNAAAILDGCRSGSIKTLSSHSRRKSGGFLPEPEAGRGSP